MKILIRTRILIIALLVPGLAVAGIILLWTSEFRKEYSQVLQTEIQLEGDHLVHQLEEILSLGIPLEKISGFEKQCQVLVYSHRGISYAMVTDLQGRILFHNDTAQQGKVIMDSDALDSIRSGKNIIEKHLRAGEEYYEGHIPVFKDKEHVATVTLGFPESVISEKTNQVITRSLLISLVFLILAVICLVVAQTIWITKPLSRLLRVIREIEKEGPSLKKAIPSGTGDEIGQLGSAFTRMMNRIRETDEQLRDFNLRLQEEVDRRTEELRATAQRLEKEIDERKSAEAALRASEERLRKSEEKFRKAIQSAPVWVLLSTLDEGRFIEVNDAFLEATGFTKGHVIGHTTIELGLWDDAKERRRFVTRLSEKGSIRNAEGRLRVASGDLIDAVINAELIELEGEKVVVSIIQDMTEHKRMEEQLRQAQKMEAVGTLTGGIAHDFNNIMTTVIGNAQLAMIELPDDNPVQEMLADIRKAGESAASLVRQLLAFSRKQVLTPEVIDLNAVLRDSEKMLRRLVREDIELKLILEPALGLVKADPGQLEQVFLNLVVNARDAMPQGGKIIIETAAVELDKDYLRRHSVEGQEGRYLMFSVSDTGIGMDKETVSRIFEPFFSTKEKGVGTGLGLSTVYGIVKQSGGFVWVYSEPGKGSTFKVYLPEAKIGAGIWDKEDKIDKGKAEGTETVLLVEDNEEVRKMTSKGLRKLGYTVLEAGRGEEAIRISREHDGRIDLLFTDVVMPGMNGAELMEKLAQERPEIKVLYMSGYTGNVIVERGVADSPRNFLQKPFSPTEAGQRIRELLDEWS